MWFYQGYMPTVTIICSIGVYGALQKQVDKQAELWKLKEKELLYGNWSCLDTLHCSPAVGLGGHLSVLYVDHNLNKISNSGRIQFQLQACVQLGSSLYKDKGSLYQQQS